MTEQPKDQPMSDEQNALMSDEALGKVTGGSGGTASFCRTHSKPYPCEADGTDRYITLL